MPYCQCEIIGETSVLETTPKPDEPRPRLQAPTRRISLSFGPAHPSAVTRILCLAQIHTAGQDEKYGNASPSFDQRRPHPADVR